MEEQSINILTVNTVDQNGGAAKIAWTLFDLFSQLGQTSQMAVGWKRSGHPSIYAIPHHLAGNCWSRFWWNIFYRYQHQRHYSRLSWLSSFLASYAAEPKKLIDALRGYEDFNFPGSRNILNITPHLPDILHFHNLHGFYFDLRSLPWLSNQLPVFLTLHDAWLLSGHCAHSFDCERWKIGCGNCPDLMIYPPILRDATAENFKRKSEIYKQCRLYLATPCGWLMEKVQQSILASAIIESRIIPSGVDLSVFSPMDKKQSRAELNLPQHSKIILFAANGIRKNIWRDFQIMKDAISIVAEKCRSQNILFIAMGEKSRPIKIGKAEIAFVEYQNDPAMVARYYQSADIYLHAARIDTFPNTILESMACGTPVIATNVGGIREAVLDGQTGYLVQSGDVRGFANCILKLIDSEELANSLSNASVNEARLRFSDKRMAADYLKWYQEVLSSKNSKI